MSEVKTLEETAIDVERARRRAKRTVDAEEQPERPPLHAYTIEELLARPRPSYLLDQWIPTGSLCQVVGEPETLKSFFMCHVGLTIASGAAKCFGHPVTHAGPVLYIAAEGGGAFQFRILGWCQEHDVDPLTVRFRVIPLPVKSCCRSWKTSNQSS
jgi:AAA domain